MERCFLVLVSRPDRRDLGSRHMMPGRAPARGEQPRGGAGIDTAASGTSGRRSALVHEPDRAQRRRLQDGGEGLPVPRLLDRLDPTPVADAGAAVALRVGVEDLPPAAAPPPAEPGA